RLNFMTLLIRQRWRYMLFTRDFEVYERDIGLPMRDIEVYERDIGLPMRDIRVYECDIDLPMRDISVFDRRDGV
ncbi:MAG: hypothetical protein MI866_14965, partial [Bacteroidales bacterium]|nr:hypothetical protein [Bacteroidales bacterium]